MLLARQRNSDTSSSAMVIDRSSETGYLGGWRGALQMCGAPTVEAHSRKAIWTTSTVRRQSLMIRRGVRSRSSIRGLSGEALDPFHAIGGGSEGVIHGHSGAADTRSSTLGSVSPVPTTAAYDVRCGRHARGVPAAGTCVRRLVRRPTVPQRSCCGLQHDPWSDDPSFRAVG